MQAAATQSVSPRAAYSQRGTNTLQHVFRDHFASFAADYDTRYAKELGNFRIERISRVATRFLACGDYPLSGSGVYSRRGSWLGVARIRCSNPECRLEYFRPFSCRGFHLCPSCSQKRSHAEPMSPQAEATEPTKVSHIACRSARARLIAKVYEIDPLLCPRCGSEMSLIAVITDPAEVRKILRHPMGGALRHLLKIGSAPPGLDPSMLN